MYAWLGAQIGTNAASIVSFVVLGIILLVTLWLCLISSRRLSNRSFRRKKQKARLSVSDSIVLDNQRHLVLVRRDAVEHLLLVGGTKDCVLIEHSIDLSEEQNEYKKKQKLNTRAIAVHESATKSKGEQSNTVTIAPPPSIEQKEQRLQTPKFSLSLENLIPKTSSQKSMHQKTVNNAKKQYFSPLETERADTSFSSLVSREEKPGTWYSLSFQQLTEASARSKSLQDCHTVNATTTSVLNNSLVDIPQSIVQQGSIFLKQSPISPVESPSKKKHSTDTAQNNTASPQIPQKSSVNRRSGKYCSDNEESFPSFQVGYTLQSTISEGYRVPFFQREKVQASFSPTEAYYTDSEKREEPEMYSTIKDMSNISKKEIL